jgi:YfiR/HmsC-like
MKNPFFTASPDECNQTLETGRFRQVGWLAGLILVLCLQQQPICAAGQELFAVNPYRVEAAFLRNFAHYVTWPPQAFRENSTPWHIGILGPDPFSGFLEHTFKGRTEQGRPFKVFRADRLDGLPPCQIVFIAFHDDAKRRAALDKLKDKPVLTVGEASDFLREGGIIRFEVDDRIRMSVNLDQARSASLSIQTKMLEVSDQVLENGVVRKMR